MNELIVLLPEYSKRQYFNYKFCNPASNFVRGFETIGSIIIRR